jgi:hypothetical protein
MGPWYYYLEYLNIDAMNEDETYYRRVQKYTFDITKKTINLPNMKGFIAIRGLDAVTALADIQVTTINPTGATSSILLNTWNNSDPSNNLTSNAGYTGMGLLEDNSISRASSSSTSPITFTFYPFVITEAIGVYGDAPNTSCTIYALL